MQSQNLTAGALNMQFPYFLGGQDRDCFSINGYGNADVRVVSVMLMQECWGENLSRKAK